ncbi:MAG: ABC transporter permease [Deltaproteobacteria bacterium]|nr:ABC transporter permease [Deltaproteobacteria bacterium]
MAWRNIWRNTRRSVLTISAICFACMILVFMLSFQLGSYETMINASVNMSTGHLQVQSAGYHKKKSMRLVVSQPGEIGGILEKIPGIAAYTFRANAFSLVSSNKRSRGVLVTGIDPEREACVSTIKTMISHGRYLEQSDTNQVIVGNLLAKSLRVKPGDELTILGQGRDGSIAATAVIVKGILSSGIDAFDRSTMQIPLQYFQAVYSMGDAVHEVVITAKSLKKVSKIKKDIQKGIDAAGRGNGLVVLDWMELIPGLLQGIEMDLVSGMIMYLVLIIVVAFSILNTFLMSIFERTREFGMLMAIGTTPGRLIKLVLIESMSLTLVGIVLGIVCGSLITLFFQSHGIDMSGSSEFMKQYGIPARLYPRLSLVSALVGPAAVFVITFLAALFPAVGIRKLKPVEAMTHI